MRIHQVPPNVLHIPIEKKMSKLRFNDPACRRLLGEPQKCGLDTCFVRILLSGEFENHDLFAHSWSISPYKIPKIKTLWRPWSIFEIFGIWCPNTYNTYKI